MKSPPINPERWRSGELVDRSYRADLPAVFAYAKEHGVRHPDLYIWLLSNYSYAKLDWRYVEPYGVIPPLNIGPPSMGESQYEYWFGEEGKGQRDTTWEGPAGVIANWVTGLVDHEFGRELGGQDFYCFDFSFDRTNPPIVRIFAEDIVVTNARGLAQSVQFVCDSFNALVALPHWDPYREKPTAKSPTQVREQDWNASRNRRVDAMRRE